MMAQIICPLLVLLWTVTTEWTMAMAMASAVKAATEKDCSSPCHCYQQSAGGGGCIYSIFCVATGLREIPQSFDFYAQILNFTGNDLAALTNDSFGSVRLQRLEIVDLSANGIKTVARDAFAALKNLLELDLSDNQIGAIGAAMLRNNRFLNTIRLSGNPIKVLGERAFPLSVYLRTLHFQGCQLKRIHRYTFFSTPLLQHLNLKDNALESPPMAMLRLTQLRVLQLDGNPWKCDRRLRRVLRWLRSRNDNGNQSLSLLCVFGETQNAILWDTMEVDGGSGSNFEKFRKLDAGGDRHSQNGRRRRRRRNKRAISAPSHKTHMARHHKTSNLSGGENIESEPEWMNMAIGYEQLPSGWNLSYAVPLNCTQRYEYSPTRFLKNHYAHPRNKARTVAASDPASASALAPAAIASAANVIVANGANATVAVVAATAPMAATAAVRSHSVYHNAKIARNYVEHPPPPSQRIADTGVGFDTIGSAKPELSSASVLVRDKRLYGQYDEESNSHYGDGDNFIEQNHVVILTGEVVLIVILLIILYRLWKENRKRVRSATAVQAAAIAEPGVNFPLNNGDARIKSYDTQTNTDADADGYRRYSLSDEEYSNIRNGVAVDEGKYDAESGYLSYHRYNSVEGDNPINNDNGDIDTQPNNRCGNGFGIGGDTRAVNDFRRRNSASRRGRMHELQHSQHPVNGAVTVDSKAIGIGTNTGTRPISDRLRSRGHSRSSFSDSGGDGDDDQDQDCNR